MGHPAEQYKAVNGVLWCAGDVIRPNTPSGREDVPADVYAFSDHIILGFSHDGPARNAEVKVARPYAYASGVGTTGPHPFLWAEEYTLYVEHSLEAGLWLRVSSGRMVKP